MNNVYIARVIDDNSGMILKELKRQNRQVKFVLGINIIFLGLVTYDLIKTKRKIRKMEDD